MTNKTRTILSQLPLLLSLSFGASVSAEVYRWTDSDGKLHFSDHPPQKDDVKAVNVELSPTTKLSVPTASTEDGVTGEALHNVKKKVVMYATSWCQYCEKARKYFRKNKIHYVEYDVEKQPKRMKEFKRRGGTGFPLILIGKKHKMHGFSASGFERRYGDPKS